MTGLDGFDGRRPERERGFEVDAVTPPHRTPVDVLVLSYARTGSC
jgi:hypothetical protein